MREGGRGRERGEKRERERERGGIEREIERERETEGVGREVWDNTNARGLSHPNYAGNDHKTGAVWSGAGL